MTADEIKQYKELIGKKIMEFFHWTGEYSGKVIDARATLHGYTSTSLSESSAFSYAWEEPETGHQKVLFHIKWMNKHAAFFLDAGAFDHEEEVLLNDGV